MSGLYHFMMFYHIMEEKGYPMGVPTVMIDNHIEEQNCVHDFSTVMEHEFLKHR